MTTDMERYEFLETKLQEAFRAVQAARTAAELLDMHEFHHDLFEAERAIQRVIKQMDK